MESVHAVVAALLQSIDAVDNRERMVLKSYARSILKNAAGEAVGSIHTKA